MQPLYSLSLSLPLSVFLSPLLSVYNIPSAVNVILILSYSKVSAFSANCSTPIRSTCPAHMYRIALSIHTNLFSVSFQRKHHTVQLHLDIPLLKLSSFYSCSHHSTRFSSKHLRRTAHQCDACVLLGSCTSPFIFYTETINAVLHSFGISPMHICNHLSSLQAIASIVERSCSGCRLGEPDRIRILCCRVKSWASFLTL